VSFDLALFERLNEEYEDRPLVPNPPAAGGDARAKAARRRIKKLSDWIDFSGKTVLEIGAGHGYLTRALVKRGGASRAVGVDVVERPSWEQLAGGKVSYRRVDLTREAAFDDGFADAIVSNAVLEHVREPIPMIQEIARLLRVGGRALLIFNLHRGPKASHRYREVFFPWPHLLFSPEVCAEFYERHHGRSQTFSWVNHLTAGQYMEAFLESGLHVERFDRRTTPIDLPFYLRFEDRLGAYPALDLETDFLFVKLHKRRRSPGRATPLGYASRQAEFTRELEPLRARS
jgi:SAM-dependent methyltransferase